MVQDCNLALHVGKQAEASTPLEVGICLLFKKQRGSNRAEVLGVRKIVACIKGNFIYWKEIDLAWMSFPCGHRAPTSS